MAIQAFPSKAELDQAAAHFVVNVAHKAVSENGRFTMALSGGGTPEGLYRLLAQTPYNHQMPWTQTHLFWGDERLVPPDAPGSNYYQIAQLLLPDTPIPPQNIHRAKGELSPAAAATDYMAQLQEFADIGFHWPHFDLVLLGMGSDGHTASLFPGPISPAETSQPVIAVTADYDGRPAHRISLTPLVFNQARHILFLVTGKNKAETLSAVLHGPYLPEKYPVQRIRPQNGTITWLVDQEVASAALSTQ